jgi:hypothetical protein
MAENRGGYRPTAPQNNPANVNPFGGNGQSGMTTNYTGFAYGQNKAVNEQRQSAPMAGQETAPNARPSLTQQMLPDIVPIDAPTQRPDEPVTHGAALGPGGGEEVLGLPPMSSFYQPDSGLAAIRALYIQDPSNQDLKRMLEYIDMGGNA